MPDTAPAPDGARNVEISVLPKNVLYLDKLLGQAGIPYTNSVNQALLVVQELRAVIQGGGQVVVHDSSGRRKRLDLPF